MTENPVESMDWSKTMASVESKVPAEPRKVFVVTLLPQCGVIF